MTRSMMITTAARCTLLTSMAFLPAILLTPTAGAQQRLFGDLHAMLPADASQSQAVALGDVDGDGDLDLFVGNGGRQSSIGLSNQLFLNDGTGIFSDATDRLPANADLTCAVALGDVDGDGDLDLLMGNCASSGHAQNRLYLNDGRGIFSDATNKLPIDDSSNTDALALGDVDGDGDLDILLGNYFFQQNQLYRNDGFGNFTDATAMLPVAADPTAAIALGDLDGDGDLDALIGNGFDGSRIPNRLYVNDGSGFFVDASAQLPEVFSDTAAIALGDVDGDGDLDALIGNGDPFIGNGLEANGLLLNDGGGVFSDASAQVPAGKDNTLDVKLMDVDGDGDLDALVGNGFQSQQDRLYLNNGAGTFRDAADRYPISSIPTAAVAMGDVDGDGDPDALVANQSGQNQLQLNGGVGNFFDATSATPRGGATQSVGFGDLNGDGNVDAILGNRGQNQLFLNDGAGMRSGTRLRLPTDNDFTLAVALGDLDGDGDLDVLFGNGSARANRLYLNDGHAIFSDASFLLPPFTESTAAILIGDADGDGDLDAYIANSFTPDRLLLNTGAGDFNGPVGLLPQSSGSGGAVAFADVDGDGDLDVFRGKQSLFRNNGNASFTEDTTAIPPLNLTIASVALGDVDGDGDLDALLGSDGQNILLLNDGAGKFSDVSFQLPVNSNDTHSVAFGDVDGDGDLDALIGNSGAGTLTAQPNRLYLNDSTGTFTDATDSMPRVAEGTNVVALEDLDRDGDLDAFIGNHAQNRIYRNLTRQLAWRGLPRSGKPLAIDLFGRASSRWILALSAGKANLPIAQGTLLLEPATLVRVGSGILDSQGLASFVFGVPSDAVLLGLSFYWQAALGTPLRLSNLERTSVKKL